MLNLRHGELPNSDKPGPGRDFITERVADLSGCEWEAALKKVEYFIQILPDLVTTKRLNLVTLLYLVKLEEPLEVDKDSLRCFGPEKAFNLAGGTDLGLEHQVELHGLREVVS